MYHAIRILFCLFIWLFFFYVEWTEKSYLILFSVDSSLEGDFECIQFAPANGEREKKPVYSHHLLLAIRKHCTKMSYLHFSSMKIAPSFSHILIKFILCSIELHYTFSRKIIPLFPMYESSEDAWNSIDFGLSLCVINKLEMFLK